MTIIPVSDKDLWNAVVQDDSRAFAVLYKRYWAKLHATANYYLKDFQAAEQIVQDVFFIMWKRRKALDITDLGAYFNTTARYHVFKHLKLGKKDIIEYLDNFQDNNVAITVNLAEERMNYDYLQNQLSIHLLALPRRCREIFWLSRVEQLSNDEISERFFISKRTVENQITRAQKHLNMQGSYSGFALFAAIILTQI